MPRLTQAIVDWPAVARDLRNSRGTYHNMTSEQIRREINRARTDVGYFGTFTRFFERNGYPMPELEYLSESCNNQYITTTGSTSHYSDNHYCEFCGDLESMGRTTDIINDAGEHFHGRCFTLYSLNQMPVNHDSMQDTFARCLACNGMRTDAEHVDTFLGPIHSSCLRTRIGRLVCAGCGAFGTQFEMVGVMYLCPSCKSSMPLKCNNCGASHSIDEGMVRIHETEDRGYLCPGCAAEMVRCVRCRQLTKSTGKNTDGLCLPCFVRSNPVRRIHRYNLKPKPKFHGKDTKRQYGLELEVDAFPTNDHNRFGLGLLYKAEKGETSFYIKSDGSLNNGYELVFHPRELSSWCSYEKKLQLLTEAIGTADGRSFNTGTCGIHVHRGVEDISGYHIVKMSYLLAKFRKLTRSIALRDPNHYAQEVRIFHSDSERSVDPRSVYNLFQQTKMSPRDRRYNVERYLQLNFQNENTIELRIFRGNLNVTTILSCIMFFDRLVEFTRKQTIKAMEQINEPDMISLFDGFCKTMTTRSTLGKRKNNAFAIVSSQVTDRIGERLGRALRNNNS